MPWFGLLWPIDDDSDRVKQRYMIGISTCGKEPGLGNIFPQSSNLTDFFLHYDSLFSLWVPLFGRPHGISRTILVKLRCIYTAGTLWIRRKLWHCEASFITCVGVSSGFPHIGVVLWEGTVLLEFHKSGHCLHCILLKSRFTSHISLWLDIHLNDPTFTLLKTVIFKTEYIFACFTETHFCLYSLVQSQLPVTAFEADHWC